MEQLASVVLTQAHCWLDRVNIYEAKIQSCVAQNQQLEALKLAREVLDTLAYLYQRNRPRQVSNTHFSIPRSCSEVGRSSRC